VQVEIQPNYIFVKVPYSQKELAKGLGGEWNQSRKMWKFVNNIYMMRSLLKTFPALMNNQYFINEGKKIKAQMDALLSIKAQEDAPGDPRLRPYQRVDVQYLKRLTAAGVFNEQRTGKTPTILTVCKELELDKVLIVCPASLLRNWESEIKTWVGNHVTCVVSKGTKQKRLQLYSNLPNYLIVSYETLRNDISAISTHVFDSVIVDEAHRLRNRDTKQSQALFQLKAHRKYALTGTPTVKDGTDIFGILSWLFPEKYTSYWKFVKRYFTIYEDYWGNTVIGDYKPETKAELQELIGFISVQRKRKDVMAWLPDKTYIPIPVEMDAKQRKVYNEMLNTFMVKVDEDEAIDAPTALAQLTRLRQLCLDPALLGIDAPSAKTDAIMEWLEDNKQPVVIMSMFTSYLHRLQTILQEKGYSVGTIHGEMANDAKFQAARDFQDGKLDILLCNIISAGVGFTLDRADTAIFTDKAWNPTDQQQAEDRIIPVDESRNHAINIITFPIADTVDEKIEKILETKTNLTEVINSGARDAIMRLLGR